jgi:TPR repeat protein
MTFKENYLKLSTDKKQNLSTLSDEATGLIGHTDLPDKWFEAMAICEAAADTGKLDDNILALRKEMFLDGRELHSSVNLNDEDYAEWFDCVVDFNKKLADAGITESWVELGSLYGHARFPHRNLTTCEKFMLKGVELDDPLAMSIYGYRLYYGMNPSKIDKVKGLELMLKAKEKNFERADVYLLISEYDADIDPEIYVKKIQDYNSSAKSSNQLWHILGDAYYEKLNDVEKSIEAHNKGIELSNNPYCKYKKAVSILRGEIDGSDSEALQMLENAYEWNVIQAADFLGQYYNSNESCRDVEKAAEWYKKAIAYGNSYSMLNLSLIYLYNDEYKDVEKGLYYIDMAIENGNVRAMCEKAYFLLETGEENKNIPIAKELLEKAFDTGDGYAAYRLGYGYQNAEFSEENDYNTAFKYYCAGADRNSVMAMEYAGHYCKTGVTGEPEPEKAAEYYCKAAELGSNYARVEFAICCENGFGVRQDFNKAFELLNIAANENYAYAHTKLGYYCLNGIVGEPDYDKAFEHFSKAAESDDFEAVYSIGRMYKYSIGRPENPERALEYFKKAADGGNADANIEMGISYEHEYGGLEFDGEQASKYMAYAAEQNHPFAQYKLGIYYYYGMVEQNMEKGLEYLEKAYENGSEYAAAALGDHFMYNGNENTDRDNAFQYYKYAAEHDYITEGVGLCYQYGIGVEQNATEAFKYYSIAADRDYTAAKYRLGLCYKHEIGTSENLAEAYGWLLAAAEEDHRTAEYEVAMMLLDGAGVPENTEKGMEWLRKAAEKEQDDAQLELGNCYLIGRGVDEDEIQAMFWYQKAAENGNEHALKITGQRDRIRR